MELTIFFLLNKNTKNDVALHKRSFLSLLKKYCEHVPKEHEYPKSSTYNTFYCFCKWKDFKRVFLVASLCSVVALLLASCAMKLNSNQQKQYDAWINGLELGASHWEIPAATIQTQLSAANFSFKTAWGFQIKDTKEGSPVAQGTKAADLKKRFVPAKAK